MTKIMLQTEQELDKLKEMVEEEISKEKMGRVENIDKIKLLNDLIYLKNKELGLIYKYRKEKQE